MHCNFSSLRGISHALRDCIVNMTLTVDSKKRPKNGAIAAFLRRCVKAFHTSSGVSMTTSHDFPQQIVEIIRKAALVRHMTVVQSIKTVNTNTPAYYCAATHLTSPLTSNRSTYKHVYKNECKTILHYSSC